MKDPCYDCPMIDTPDSIHAEYEALIGEKLPAIFYDGQLGDAVCSTCRRSQNHGDALPFTAGDMLSHVFRLSPNGQSNSCRRCGLAIHCDATIFKKLDSSVCTRHAATESDEILDLPWFHATDRLGWDRHLRDGSFLSLHAGPRLTAFDRAANRDRDQIFMYELKIIPAELDGENLIQEFVPDAEADWDELHEDHVHPYINEWETAGVTTIYASRTRVKIIGREDIDMVQLREMITEVRERELAMLTAMGLPAKQGL